MASDNQPISDKRRRLFKALSAAPIVATLRPGEALANSSAFQCAAKMGEAQFFRHSSATTKNKRPIGREGVGMDCSRFLGYVIYRKRADYWKFKKVTSPCTNRRQVR